MSRTRPTRCPLHKQARPLSFVIKRMQTQLRRYRIGIISRRLRESGFLGHSSRNSRRNNNNNNHRHRTNEMHDNVVIIVATIIVTGLFERVMFNSIQ